MKMISSEFVASFSHSFQYFIHNADIIVQVFFLVKIGETFHQLSCFRLRVLAKLINVNVNGASADFIAEITNHIIIVLICHLETTKTTTYNHDTRSTKERTFLTYTFAKTMKLISAKKLKNEIQYQMM